MKHTAMIGNILHIAKNFSKNFGSLILPTGLVQRPDDCLRAGGRDTKVFHDTNARAGGKSAKPHVSPLAGRTISLVDGGIGGGKIFII
jgi:hypothetical protein